MYIIAAHGYGTTLVPSKKNEALSCKTLSALASYPGPALVWVKGAGKYNVN